MEPNLAGAGHEAIGHEALGVYLGRDARSSALVGMALLGPRRAAVSEAEGGAGGEGGKGGEGVRSNPSPALALALTVAPTLTRRGRALAAAAARRGGG